MMRLIRLPQLFVCCLVKPAFVAVSILAMAFNFVAQTFAETSVNGLSEEPLAAHSAPRGQTLFATLAPTETGVVTENKYADPGVSKSGYKDPRMWADRYREFQVGAIGTGVAIGDYDGDGRADIFVVSKTESCRLFRNLGGWKFEDVTEKAGVGDQGEAAGIWKQGVSFADVNNDGRLDLYVCRFGAPNLLYINQGDGTFKEEAAARGLAVNDASVMASFCDYDRDGFLDVYIQTNLLDGVAHPQGQRDYLFHNNGDGKFTNVTDRAGIKGETQGHSATWWDYDNDGWPDLYVANDFAAPDSLYHNNRDGTFVEVAAKALPHVPSSSMGSDFGDLNNDGHFDFLVADMAATTHQKDQRTMAAARGMSRDPAENSSVVPQLLHNALYLNTGVGVMQEAAFLAGLDATDWTWSVRFEDLDNDGRLDLHVTNGMHREVHNVDLLQRLDTAQTQTDRQRMEHNSPVLSEANVAYVNEGELRFREVGVEWGLNQKGVSFGAAFGDLDGDGDVDLVYGNYQSGVTVLRNDSDTGHRVIFALRGVQSNRFGVGATVRIETTSGPQVRQLVLARGVLSSSEPVLHFGLGEDTNLQRVTIEWPSGRTQSFTDLAADRKYTITEPAGAVPSPPTAKTAPSSAGQFSEESQKINFALSAREETVDEIGPNPLQPMRQNRRGPSLAVGELNGDGHDDVVMGGTPADPTRVLFHEAGKFAAHAGALPASGLNDGPVLLFDADGDGRNDLLVSKAGINRPAGSAEYQPVLYLNHGQGEFTPAPANTLPPLSISTGALVAADFDRDGRLDVFIGAKVVPGQYPFAPRSALLANRGGRFEDVTDTVAPGLRTVGMVTSALWSDADGDGWLDLFVAVEWGVVRYFHNEQGKGLTDWTDKAGFAAAGTGWWSSLASADFNGDGRPDYVAGNVGLNTQYRADATHPAVLYAGDFKGDGSQQLIEGYYEGEKLYPWRTRRDLGAVLPSILKKYPRNDLYARASLGEIFGEAKLAAADKFAATELRSGVFLSQPDGTYRFEALPRLAQIAPCQGLVAGDFDGDGHADIYTVQNSYAPIPSVGRFDGGLSQLLQGDGEGHFKGVPPAESNLVVPGDAKALAVVDFDQDGWPDFLVTRNNAPTLAFRNHGVAGRHSLAVRLKGPAGNPTGIGARITLELAGGSKQTAELFAGSGYASQSSATGFFGWTDAHPPHQLTVRWPNGSSSHHPVTAGDTTITLDAVH